MKNKILLAFVVGGAAGVAAGCQTYDFEPVEPLAIAQTTQSRTISGKQPKPNVMFLIDKSGSMNFPANDTIAPCTPGCGGTGNPACASGCRTRMQELKSAMQTFLGAGTDIAWMGMAIYPTAASTDSCGATTSADILVPLEPKIDDNSPDLIASAAAVNAKIQALSANGGTPTGDSLKFLGGMPALADPDPKVVRADHILLLTDGLPNCNAANVNSCTNVAACRCTQPDAPGLGPGSGCGTTSTAAFCTKGCLDKDNSAAQVTALRQKNIKTIVIGFGADTAVGDGPETLNAMAQNGGFARLCPNGTNTECGANNTCNTATNICNRAFYQASSALELQVVLADISKAINPLDACNYKLDEIPTDPKFLAVIIDGQNSPAETPDTWTYSAGTVTFQGALCTKVSNASTVKPVQVEFRIVNSL